MDNMHELATAAKRSAEHLETLDVLISRLRGLGYDERQLSFASEKHADYSAKVAKHKTFTPATHPSLHKTRAYERAGLLPIDFVLANAGNHDVQTPLGVPIGFTSWRVQHYAAKGVRCANCGMTGTTFAAERQHSQHGETSKFHLNLYHVAVDGAETMITVDHIVAKANGGTNNPSNLQTLCQPCNGAKGCKLVIQKGEAA